MMGAPATGKRGLGTSNERGLKRVALEGPPTRMTAFNCDMMTRKGRTLLLQCSADHFG